MLSGQACPEPRQQRKRTQGARHSEPPESDQQYLERRAEEERRLAERQSDPRARIPHLELAARYALRAANIPEGSGETS